MLQAGTLPVAEGPVAEGNGPPGVRIRDGQPVEDWLRVYLDDCRFKSRYPRAHERWFEAWAMLWRADSRARVISVASEAREALNEFACALVQRREPHATLPDGRDTLLRLSALIEMYRRDLGDERCGLQQALLEHWETLSDVVRRHENPAQRVHGRLHWQDGRRIVILTALIMVEIDRCL